MFLFKSSRKNKNLNDVIFDSAPVGIATITPGGVFDSVNSKFLEIHGAKKKSEFIGLNALELPFYKQSGLDKFLRQALNGQRFDTEISFTSSAGARESFRRYFGVPIFGSDAKKIEMVLLTAEDITEKKRMEIDIQDYLTKLKQEQSQLLASINSLPLGFIIIDTKNNLLIENEAIDRILQLPEFEGGDVFLRGDVSLIEERLKNSFDLRSSYEKCIKEKQVINVKEILFENKFLRMFLAPIIIAKGPQEEVIGVAILMEDITEAKVTERSREEFFAIASHELRTPLTAIRGNASLIQEFYKDQVKGEEVTKMIIDIHDASVRLIKIVNDFLESSRLEQGRLEFKKESFNLVDLIKEVMAGLEKLAADKKLYLKLAKIGSLPLAAADKDRTKEILTNLIGNAINYSQKGGITVNVEKQDKFLKTCVTDTGVGISAENQTLLFRKFQQAGEKVLTRDVSKGTGLGLYISKLLVETMGGTIELVKSQPGVGSTFGFTLPIAL